jgi:putative ABC transport system permease protein
MFVGLRLRSRCHTHPNAGTPSRTNSSRVIPTLMLANYFKISWRNFIKNKVSSFINVTGLAVGMSVAMLIGLWIWDELSFNKYHKKYDCIVQVMREQSFRGERGMSPYHPIPMGDELRSLYGNYFKSIIVATQTEEHIVSSGEKKFTQSGNYMDPATPQMLTLRMRSGTTDGLKTPSSIFLSESLAKKLFADVDPINQVVKLDNKETLVVRGVYEDLPKNSKFTDTKFILPFDLYVSTNEWIRTHPDDWRNFNIMIYAEIPLNADHVDISAKIKNAYAGHIDNELAAQKPQLVLHPMRKWHLHSKFENGVNVMSEQMKFVWFYGIIGVFVLLLACINFMNLSTARSEKRAKEVGIRKSIGSKRSQLIAQFLSESILISIASFVCGIVIVELILPWFNRVSDKQIVLLWSEHWFWMAGLAFTFFTGLLAGSYPALYLSSFNATKVLKVSFRAGRLAAVPRKILVVVQFTVSIALIIGTIVVYRQIELAKDRPVGYSQQGLLSLQVTSLDFEGKYEVLRNELKNTGAVTEMARSNSPLTGIWSNNKEFNWKGKEPSLEVPFGTPFVTQEYGKTVGWKFKKGRDFRKDLSTDSSAVIINEATAKVLGIENPVGQTLVWERTDGNRHYTIIGIIQDMVMESPFEAVRPTLYFLGRQSQFIFIRINPAVSAREALPKIEDAFRKVISSVPFDYKFADEDYRKKFAAETRIGNLATFFAGLAILISCLGLFGLASFVAEQRTKEIGVRKVLGASVFNVWQLLSKDFVVLVMVSLVIAVPIAYYSMHVWLQGYQYRASMSWWIFAAAGGCALVITLLTISFQAIKAGIANPVRSLRTE